jgi:hypothetical protein
MTIAKGEPLLASDINNLTFFPKGTILMYDGAGWVNNETIPGWYKCDGTNGTPNLINKFIRGSAVAYNGNALANGASGGIDNQVVTLTANNMPSHSHTVIDPGHAHQFKYNPKNAVGGVWAYMGYEAQGTGGMYTDKTTTGISIGSAGSGNPFTVNTVPSYYSVIYIRKMV